MIDPANVPVPDQPVSYGIVGVGGYGGERRKQLRQSGAFRIVGGVDVREEAFERAEKEEGVPLKRYENVEALAADPQIEAVVISTPAHLHVEQAMIAAEAGKAIFVEKPLGHDRAACLELVAYCEQHEIPHGHGFSLRYTPLWQHVRGLLAAGELGRVVSVSAAGMHTGGLVFRGENWRFVAGRNPGGPLFQCGIHKIDLLRYLFGNGQWHAGIVQSDITESPTDDAYVLLGTFGEDRVPATMHGHYVASYRHAMEIYGTKGDLFITEHPEKLEIKRTDPGSGFEPIIDITDEIEPTDVYGDILRDFAHAVRERRQPAMNGREGLISLDLIFSAVKVAVPARAPQSV